MAVSPRVTLPAVQPVGLSLLSPALPWDAAMAAESCVPGTQLPFSRDISLVGPSTTQYCSCSRQKMTLETEDRS